MQIEFRNVIGQQPPHNIGRSARRRLHRRLPGLYHARLLPGHYHGGRERDRQPHVCDPPGNRGRSI